MSDKPYQQSDDYIPRSDSGFRDFLHNFATLIQADPNKYGLSESDAQIITNHDESYEAAYVPVQSAATRTTALVGQKDAVKAAAIASVRVYAMIIKANKGVDNEDKLALGIRVNDPTPTPIPAPDSAPLLSIVAAFSGEHVIRFSDENTPASRKKPHGAIQIQINRKIAYGADPVVEGSELVGLYTKQPIQVPQEQMNAGKTASYFGRWVTRTGLFGPWSLPVGMTIAFGGPVDQQIPVGGTPQTLEGGDDLKIAA